jgi:hypothetical protein
MPEFFAEHTPDDIDAIAAGYLECAEWLLDDQSPRDEGGIDRSKIRGWSRRAIKEAKQDCRDFAKANKADIAIYCELTGRGLGSVGHDLWLTRNGHGAGFWDRGSDPVFDRLTDAARLGEADVYCSRGWLQFS